MGILTKNLFKRQDWEMQSVKVLSVILKSSSRDIGFTAHYNFSYPSQQLIDMQLPFLLSAPYM